MSRNGHWQIALAAILFVAPCLYIVGELTQVDAPGRGRGTAEAAAQAARDASRARAGLSRAGSAEDGAESGGRRGGLADAGSAASYGARGSRGVYSFPAAASGAAGKPVDASYRNSDPDFGLRAGQFFDPRDLAVLDDIIRLNQLDEDSSGIDYDDGDGVLEPTELGSQIWCGSRLRVLQLGPTSFASFGYQVRELPETLANLDNLVMLESNGTGLESLPEALGQLQDLERVSALGNRLKEIPPELALAGRLRELQLADNEISEIPRELQRKTGLKALFVDDNPIRQMPRMLVQQNQKLMQGKLALPMRDLRSFGPNCRVL